MRYTADHKKESREKLLRAVGRGFRKRGYGGIGVDGLAKEGDVTSGAFYSHFQSKDEAFAEALIAGLLELKEGAATLQREKGDAWLEAFVDFYVGFRRTCDLSESCALQSLTSDVIRAEQGLKDKFQAALTDIATTIAEGLEGGTAQARFARAIALLSLLSGGVTMARAVTDPKLSETMARSIKASALLVARTQ